MSRVFFIADLHHGHKNICKYRTQFSSPEEHDGVLCDNILSTVGKRDSLWLLGDLFFTEESMQYFHKYLERVKSLQVVIGNHCSDNPERQRNLQTIVQHCKVHSLVKYKDFWLSHAPIHPQELRGKKNIHGHMHNEVVNSKDYISVCCEQVGYKPISMEEIRDRV